MTGNTLPSDSTSERDQTIVRLSDDRSGRTESNGGSDMPRSEAGRCDRRQFLRGIGVVASIGALPGIAVPAAADDDASLPNDIVIVNDDESDEKNVTYRFTVSGSVEALSDPGGDDADGDTASGTVHTWKDGYDYSGEITSFEYSGPATVLLDGTQVDPGLLGSGSGDDGDDEDDESGGDDGGGEDGEDGNFETVAVPAGETYTRRIGDDEVLENVCFDISAEESHVNIDCRGDGWTLRNVGVKGTSTYPEKTQVIHVNCDGEGLIENVYLGDGSDAECHGTGIFVNRKSEGTLTIRNANVQDWVDNGIYASAPGHAFKSHGGCEVVIEDSYGRNNNTANFRIGSDGSAVRDCVSVVDGPVPAKIGPDGEENHNCRPVWVTEGGDCTVEECDLVAIHEHASYCVVESEHDVGGTVRVTDCRLTTREKRWTTGNGEIIPENVSYPDEDEAKTAVPEGVPETAEAAASGGSR